MLLRRANRDNQAPVLTLLKGADLPTEGVEIHGLDALLRSVAVALEVRGTGLGSAITGRALTEARESGLGAVYLLTTTAESFFPRFGFERIGWDLVPARVQESREFRGVCPSSAVAMRARLEAVVATESSR